METYDVIIRHRRGGGTSPPPGAVGQEDLPAGARGMAAARALELGSHSEVFVENRYVPEDTWYDVTASRSTQFPTSWAAATELTGPRLPPARGTSASSTLRGSRPPGRSPTTSSSRTTRRRRTSIRFTEREVRTRPSRTQVDRIPIQPLSHEPRIQQLSDDLAAAGYRPFHVLRGILLDESNPPYSTCVRCAPPAMASHASCMRSRTPRCIAVRPALEHPNVTLLTNAKAVTA